VLPSRKTGRENSLISPMKQYATELHKKVSKERLGRDQNVFRRGSLNPVGGASWSAGEPLAQTAIFTPENGRGLFMPCSSYKNLYYWWLLASALI